MARLIARMLSIDTFDVVATTLILVLVVAVGLVILHGDNVGVAVQQVTPQGEASSKAAIQFVFDEPPQLTSVQTHIQISPAIPGQFSVLDKTVIFQPQGALRQAQTYQVTIQAGLTTTTGRR